MTNGQWPQARLYATRKGWTEDSQCQLCHEAVGTLMHRAQCPMTCPHGGWTAPPKQAAVFRNQLSTAGRTLLDTHALAVGKASIPLADENEEIVWLKALDDTVNEGTISWYIDGSTIDGPSLTLSRTGVGFAGVHPDGQLAS